jgi:multidrug resistance efflux pump
MTKAELELEIANARLDAANARAMRAEKDWGRAKSLLPNSIPLSEADQVECDYKVAQAELREATALVEIAKLGLGM